MKKISMLLIITLALGLTACEKTEDNNIAGADWRTTGTIDSYGSITRNGEDTDVLVCVHPTDAMFYLDTEEQTLYDSVTYPTEIDAEFQSIDFADRNGDGNGDVAMTFTKDDEMTLMVWFWESDSFVYQPDESWIPGLE